MNHADHGWYDYMGTGDRNHGWGIDNGDVDALINNDKPSIIVSLACDVNGMDDPYGYDCIAEHFVIYNPNQAGVAYTGNTRSGLYYQGDAYRQYLSGKLDYWWWRSLFSLDKYILGETLVESKHHFGTDPWNPNAGRHCVWEFNLLGDPAMPIWTDTPLSLDVTHPDTLPIGSSVFTVHVESSGAPVENAYVCLWKGDEAYLRDYTDVNGDVSFTPSPSTVGTMDVTVTKHNYLPYEGEATVVGGNQLPYVPSNPSPSDGATGVNIDADLSWDGGDPDSGDSVYYDVYFDTDPSPLFVERIGPYPATQTTITYDPGTLSYNTQYYWKINAEDNHGAGSEGPVWDFITEELNQPPYTPSNPDPLNSAIDVNVNSDLSWDGGDPNSGDTVYYEVYLGVSSPPGYYSTTPTYPATHTRINYDPGTLDINTHYYWQIVSWDSHGESSYGPIWEFTTAGLPPPEQFYANQDIPVQNGGITGSYTDTHNSDDIYEGITERKIGPRSRLEHKWTIDITGGHTLYVFYLEAYHTSNSEGDDFLFSYSTDDSIYTEMVTVTKTSDDDSYQTYFLPILSGTVYIKVEDTDWTRGHTILDTVYIDHMYIEASSPPNRPPATPTDPIPENGATNVDIDPTLSVTVSDPDGDSMDVTFYNASDHSIIDVDYDVPNGGTASIIWDNLAYETNYSWYTIADDGEYTNTSDTWSFSTRGEAPPGGMYVWDISWRIKIAGRNTFLYHTITVKWDSDGDGIAEEADEFVSDATVFSLFTQNGTTNSWEFSGVTDTNGQVEFGAKVTAGDFKAEVTGIVHSIYSYTPELDVDNPDYYTII